MRRKSALKVVSAVCVLALVVNVCIVHSAVSDVRPGKTARAARQYNVAIDAGHQKKQNLSMERIGPNTRRTKYKMAGGATGVSTHQQEYALNLKISKLLQADLEKRGYKVYMVRNRNDVNIGCKARALKINKSGADICIRIHADSYGSSAHGASALYKPRKNSYYSTKDVKNGKRLSSCVLNSMCRKTGAYNRGLFTRNDLTGNNWSKIPVTLVEVGFLSNPGEDRKMNTKKYQQKISTGIANGIDKYFRK